MRGISTSVSAAQLAENPAPEGESGALLPAQLIPRHDFTRRDHAIHLENEPAKASHHTGESP